MKRFLIFLSVICICTIAFAETITINWLNTDGTINQTTTCTVGGDVVLPNNIPQKSGYTFKGYVDKYTPLEYIESTGGQWIDTGYKATANANIKTKIYINTKAGSFFGSSGLGLDNYSNRYRFFHGNNNQLVAPTDINSITEIETKQSTISIYTNGVYYSGSANGASYPAENMYIFSKNGSSPAYMRVYYFQIYENDVLVHDFIPVIDSNGIACLYDSIEYKFYYNSGTGDFTAGPAINNE